MNPNLLTNKRIFIIEDNMANVVIERMLLEQKGARVITDRWGIDAPAHIRKAMPVELILLDLMFPENISGYDVFRDLRAHTEFDHIPIIAVSASDPSTAIPKTQAYGFNGFIAKPVSFDLFPEQIARILNGEKVWYRG